MIKPLQLFVIFLLLIPFSLYGEGSKQLTPNKSASPLTDPNNDKSGYLAHDANFPSANGVSISSLSFLKPVGFARNGATYSKDHRLYIRVKAGETMYYGVHRAIHDQTTANQADLIITVRRTNAITGADDETYNYPATLTRDTKSTRQMLLVANQSGVIDNATEAENGPNRPALGGKLAVTAGYNALKITNSTATDYDYYVEFTQVGEANMADGQRFSVYDFWDFTVIDASGNEKQGRMRSKLWAFSSGGTTNVFSKNFNMFPLIPSQDQANKYFVKKVELAGIAPQNFFRFVTNAFGSDATVGTTFEERRKSQTSQKDYAEFFSFVNSPDLAEWPSVTTPTFSVSSINNYCNTATKGGKSVFTLYSSDRSNFILLIDLDGTAGYQAGTKDVLLEQTGAAGTRTLEWNGLDGKGNPVPKNAVISYMFRNGCAPINFPMWDAEVNNGFRVEDVRPVAGSNYNGLLFWDDTNLSTTAFPVPQSQLFGIAPVTSNTTGVHSWGSLASTAANYNAGDLKTVNTWSYGYTNEITQATTFTYDCSADVAVTNTAASSPYTIGKEFNYTVTVTNNGPMVATGVAVTDLLDASKLQFISASDATYNSATGLWTVGSLIVGASRTLTITAKPLVTGAIAATASQTHTEADNVPDNNMATATIFVVEAADIAVTNTVPQTTYNYGDRVTYTITAQNLGPNNANGVEINDKLPAAFASNTITYVTPAGTTYNIASGTWSVGSIGINELKTITITGTVAQLGSITNTATLGDRSGLQLDQNSGNNTASNTIMVMPAADVQVSSTVSNLTPNQNEDIIYTLTVRNNGPNTATNVKLANQVPIGLEIRSYSTTLGTVNTTTQEWNVGTIAPGGTQTLTVYARPTVTGALTLTSAQSHTEYDRVSNNNSASVTINVAPTADVAVTNTVSAPANSNYVNKEQVTYTVTVTNNGPGVATNITITDQLPAALTYLDFTSSAGTGAYDAGTGTWLVGTLASGGSATLTINATINQSAVITTTATQTHTEFDNVNGNNSASNSIQSGSGVITADLNVLTSANATIYHTGDLVFYTVKVTNQGPDEATAVTVSAALPTGLTYVSGTPKVGTYDQSTGTWIIPNLASGTFTELILVGRLNADATISGDKNYAFTASMVKLNQVDNDNTDNSHTTDITVQKHADVSTSISVSGNSPDGLYYNNITEATFEITVTNNGPDWVTNLKVQSPHNTRLKFTGYDNPTGTTYDFATGLWTIGDLEPGVTKTLTVKTIPNATGRIGLNSQVASADQYDGASENNNALALLIALPVANVVVTNTASATFNNGETTTFTVTVQNNGPDAATNLEIEDILPAGLTLVNAVTSSGTYTNGIWTLGTDLLAGAANTQTMTLTVKPQSAGTYSTTAKVVAINEYDNVPANNSQTATIQGNATADIALSSTIGVGPYYIGETYNVTVTATNNGPDPASGVVVAAVVAPGLMLVPGSGTPDAGTSIDPATGIWTIGNLGVNESKNLTLLFKPIQTGVQNNLGYKQAANEYDPNGGNARNGNNSTVISLTVADRPATAQVLLNNKHYFFFHTGQNIALITDPDGPIQNTTFVSGTKNGVALTGLPAGTRLQNNGMLEVAYEFALQPGTYSVIIKTVDQYGGVTQNTLNYTVSNDWDNDGVPDDIDLDDNNDGIITETGAVNPTGDDDNDGIYNFLDKDFIHPVFGVFRDINNDEINDAFDIDLDGLLRGFDIDIDGDGIPNIIEAYGGVIPAGNIYDPLTGKIKGGVNEFGIPLAILKGGTNNQSVVPGLDSDGDTRRDYEDIDADNDGIADNTEAQVSNPFIARWGRDTDVDGLDDAYDVSCGCGTDGFAVMPINFDGIDNFDYLDLDTDNDELPDYIEGFDDNQNGFAIDDLKARAANFERVQQKNYYTTADANNDGVPDWMELVDGKPAYLKYGTAYYHDSDKNGLVDLFDSQTGGRTVTLQTIETDNQYSFRSATRLVILPVTLVTFTGKYQAGTVLLNWVTASEVNNQHFVIERSSDGLNFTEIGKLNGAGNSHQLLNYAFRDTKYQSNINYYRLKQVDVDGKWEYSKIVAVKIADQNRKNLQVTLYPNPAAGYFYLNLTALPPELVQVEIVSIRGQVLLHKEIAAGNNNKVDISSLSSGNYLVRIRSNTFSQTLHLVKE